MKFVENIKGAYNDTTEELDSGDIVQVILIVAGFTIVTILVLSLLSEAIIKKGEDVANCIDGVKISSDGTKIEPCGEDTTP